MEKVIKFSGWTPSPNTVTIGMERDNKVFSLKFEGMPDYPNGTAYLHIDCGENGADSIEVVDGTAEITRNVTQYEGEKEAYVEILADGDVVWHSDVIMVTVKRLPILGEKIKQEYPTAFEQALAQTAADKAAAAKSAADAAATAAGIVTEEAARQDAERKRVAAETARGKAEGTRAENERLRASAESERVKAEAARETAEANREQAETAREQEMAEAMASVAGVENVVRANEQQRVLAENARADAEERRKATEKSRTEAETLRVQEEQHRETAETSRAEAERQRESMETSRQTAETARNAAESERVTAEQDRVSAESQRQQAETARADAEGKRVEAEQERVTAEQGRVEAEAQREEAMAQHAEKITKLESEVAKKAEIDDTTVSDTEAWSSQHIVDVLCPPLEESGNPVVCYPVAGSELSVTASWEPTQKGEGTPYPAGGGKNLFRLYDKDATVSANGLTAKFDLKAETLTVSGTSTKTDAAWLIINQRAGLQIPDFAIGETYTLSWTKITGMYVQIVYTDTSGGLRALCYLDSTTVSFTVPTNYASFFAFQVGVNQTAGTVSGVAKIQLEKGSTATTYAPYANIRPIHGRNSVKVERCGENLLNIPPFTAFTKQGITYEYVANGGVRISGTAKANVDSPTFAVGHLPPGKYYGLDMGTGIAASIVVQRNGSNLWLNANGVFEILAGDTIKYWYMIANNGMTLDTTVYPYIVPGTTAPATYTPYSGSTATLTLPSTIYGGKVGAEGAGQETWALLTLDGTEAWDKYGSVTEEAGASCFSLYIDDKDVGFGTSVCNQFANTKNSNPFYNVNMKKFTYTDHPSIKNIYMNYGDDQTVTIDAWKAYLAAQYAAGTPVQIAYKLATPISFTATGGGAIKALSGTNTVLTDADTLTVSGRADPIRIIQQLQAASAAATQALADVERAVTDI